MAAVRSLTRRWFAVTVHERADFTSDVGVEVSFEGDEEGLESLALFMPPRPLRCLWGGFEAIEAADRPRWGACFPMLESWRCTYGSM
eukprot:CAMPEP_0206463980 /NCGR_PEP_ID=MMETSP0324_2-20121206/26939_1 /ASSEMBLY_ACC=CAM_ASM_000836 /TAXON_ID=2866 /ORGANISM="Crypthecodinium cohnii, Strain Seligo" /LENGTH=86 /DNA_ID=CAMNT_0053936515 /DNA_START=506 /DNA_END=763 /DNA_ORIENTATION=+